jgi:hypothetical protein
MRGVSTSGNRLVSSTVRAALLEYGTLATVLISITDQAGFGRRAAVRGVATRLNDGVRLAVVTAVLQAAAVARVAAGDADVALSSRSITQVRSTAIFDGHESGTPVVTTHERRAGALMLVDGAYGSVASLLGSIAERCGITQRCAFPTGASLIANAKLGAAALIFTGGTRGIFTNLGGCIAMSR